MDSLTPNILDVTFFTGPLVVQVIPAAKKYSELKWKELTRQSTTSVNKHKQTLLETVTPPSIWECSDQELTHIYHSSKRPKLTIRRH